MGVRACQHGCSKETGPCFKHRPAAPSSPPTQATAGHAGESAPWRLSDDDRVAWSRTIPGHLWDPVGRICECGVEVGAVCDEQTVEQHLAAAAAAAAHQQAETEEESR